MQIGSVRDIFDVILVDFFLDDGSSDNRLADSLIYIQIEGIRLRLDHLLP
jgi:hypothetical protein